MKLELLPNEMILNLFEYIPIFDLFHSFFNLNTRSNQLLCDQFQKFHLDLRFLSKTKVNYIFKNYIPLIINQIISIDLSNNDDIPQHIEHFLSQHFRLRQFTCLQSISLSNISSASLLDQITVEFYYLPYLTHFTLTNDRTITSRNGSIGFLNNLWRLKNLIYCHLNIPCISKGYFANVFVISKSIQHLIIENMTCSLNELACLYEYTPNLRSLSIYILDRVNPSQVPLYTFSIVRLTIKIIDSLKILEYILQMMRNLSYLKCEAKNIYISGDQWEKMIQKYLPQLKNFHFKTSFSICNDGSKVAQVDEIIDTYRTQFWINEHKWFIQCLWCDSHMLNGLARIDLFTLPYKFHTFSDITKCIFTKSSCPIDDEYFICDDVTDLHYITDYHVGFNTCSIRFSNLHRLTLELPFNDQFFITVPKLDQLTSLHVYTLRTTNLDNVVLGLQCIFDRAPRLHSLSIGGDIIMFWKTVLLKVTSTSVRCLDLLGWSFTANKWSGFNEEQCIAFSLSPLGKQCETLKIQVTNRNNVLDLVNNMPNLQVLYVRCKDDNFTCKDHQVRSINDEVIKWLKEQLSSTWKIQRDSKDFHYIQLWIDK